MKTQRTQEQTDKRERREEEIKYGSKEIFVRVFDPMYGGCTIVELAPLPSYKIRDYLDIMTGM